MTRRRANPYADGRGPKPLSIAEKLIRRCVRDESTGCLIWAGGGDKDGYGKVWHDRKSIPAHRARWLDEHGELPDKPLQILHTCDRPPCTELTHLYVGTQKKNMEDKMKRGRWKGGRPRSVKP